MTGVILINFGGPRNGEEIRPFLKDLFKDVLPRPLKPLASILANLRAPYAKKMYDAISGASPVVGWTIKQAVELEGKLGRGYRVYTGMKYGHPSIEEAIEDAKADGCEDIVLLPLFPYHSKYTAINLSTIEPSNYRTIALSHQPWHLHPLYISTMVDIIKTALANWKNIPPPEITLLFSVHAIPLSSAKNEPYVKQVYESVGEIMKFFTGCNHQIAFQSQAGPIRWTAPDVKSVLHKIRTIAPSGNRTIALIIPLGFASENIETLFEIDQIYLPYGKKLGFRNIARTPCFNDNPQFIDLLAELVIFSICSNEPTNQRPPLHLRRAGTNAQ